MSDTGVPVHREPALGRPRRMPSRRRYGLALLLALVGVVASVVLQIASQAALSSRADGFLRASVPGELTLHVDQPATFYVYAEATLSLHPSVRVTDPAGRAVTVAATAPGPRYDHGGSGGFAVGRFDATASGDYRIAVDTGDAVQGDFAVGSRFPLWMRLVPDAVGWAILGIGVGSGVVLATTTAVQRRRRPR